MTSGQRNDEPPTRDEPPRDHHVCPWWMGYVIANPLRRIFEDPKRILTPLVRPGMTAVDIGCAMGFFSLPLARMVGNDGRVVCVDLQPRMLSTLLRRARRRRLDHIIEGRRCTPDDLNIQDLTGVADLVLAIHVVHETPHPERFLAACRDALRPGGRLLIIEPRGHVSVEDFDATIGQARELGLQDVEMDAPGKSLRRLFDKPR